MPSGRGKHAPPGATLARDYTQARSLDDHGAFCVCHDAWTIRCGSILYQSCVNFYMNEHDVCVLVQSVHDGWSISGLCMEYHRGLNFRISIQAESTYSPVEFVLVVNVLHKNLSEIHSTMISFFCSLSGHFSPNRHSKLPLQRKLSLILIVDCASFFRA